MIREELQRNGKKSTGIRTALLVLVCTLLGSVGGASLYASGLLGGAPKTPPAATAPAPTTGITAEQATTIESAVAKSAIPSIVGITTRSTRTTKSPFGFPTRGTVEAVGSGIIVSEDGYILTNSHVINDGNTEAVNVLLSTDEELPAKIVWNDSTLDLAVIKVEKKGLPTIAFGDAQKVNVGDKAIAIGNPLGLDLQSTLTSGYISGLNRSITLKDGNTMDGLVQTDAAINGGNSGGALLNAKGELIGVNTAKPTAADGIGFAIPVSTVKPIVDKIIKDGDFQPLYVGITGFNAQLAAQMGLLGKDNAKGVVVRDVIPDSPAANAGIKQGDIIKAIDGKPIDSMNSLKTLLLNYKPGDKAEIVYNRSGEEQKQTITFTEFTPPKQKAPEQNPQQTPKGEEGEGWVPFPFFQGPSEN